MKLVRIQGPSPSVHFEPRDDSLSHQEKMVVVREAELAQLEKMYNDLVERRDNESYYDTMIGGLVALRAEVHDRYEKAVKAMLALGIQISDNDTDSQAYEMRLRYTTAISEVLRILELYNENKA